MERLVVVNSVLLLVLGLAVLGLWLGRHPNHPPGRKGIAGTPMSRSELLRRIQLFMLAPLALLCVGALVYSNQ